LTLAVESAEDKAASYVVVAAALTGCA